MEPVSRLMIVVALTMIMPVNTSCENKDKNILESFLFKNSKKDAENYLKKLELSSELCNISIKGIKIANRWVIGSGK